MSRGGHGKIWLITPWISPDDSVEGLDVVTLRVTEGGAGLDTMDTVDSVTTDNLVVRVELVLPVPVPGLLQIPVTYRFFLTNKNF